METSQGKALLSVGVDAILSHQPQPLNKTKVRFDRPRLPVRASLKTHADVEADSSRGLVRIIGM